MDTAIETFLSERKADRIKKQLKSNTLEHEKILIEQEIEKEFLLENWLPNAAKRAGQLSLVSHPAKFSHPSAKSRQIIFNSNYEADGFLRSGNTNIELDVFGNAAVMDVYKFLSVQLSDGKTILKHLELQSDKIKSDLKISSMSFDELRNGFLAIKKCKEVELTDTKIKQVYFPVEGAYHLLSILSSSGLIYKLKEKINRIHFSEETKKAREDRKEDIHNKEGFDELYNLSIIGYGGTKPQNISVLNSANGGKAYLFPSSPPTLDPKYLRLPHNDFFVESLWRNEFSNKFEALHKIFNSYYKNRNIRDSRDTWLRLIIDQVIDKMWTLRSVASGWSNKDNCKLPLYQKIWLDNARQEDREKNTNWLNELTSHFARWVRAAYEKIISKEAKKLDDEDLDYIRKIIEQSEEDLK